MAKRTIYVSDFSSKPIEEKDAVRITMNFSDARRGVFVADAHTSDDIVRLITEKGTKQARRGRKPKEVA